MNNPAYLIVHTEAPPTIVSGDRFNIVNQYHQQRGFTLSSLGFYVGYHWFIEKSGKTIQARLDTDIGCHTIGFNDKSIGICMAGNGDLEMPTDAQKQALGELLKQYQAKYTIPTENILPHRKFITTPNPKTCYGSLLDDQWAQRIMLQTNEISLLKKVVDLLLKLFK